MPQIDFYICAKLILFISNYFLFFASNGKSKVDVPSKELDLHVFTSSDLTSTLISTFLFQLLFEFDLEGTDVKQNFFDVSISNTYVGRIHSYGN